MSLIHMESKALYRKIRGNELYMGVTAPEVRRAGAIKRERRARYARMDESKTMRKT